MVVEKQYNVFEKRLINDIGWTRELKHRLGEKERLGGIDLLYDFNWREIIGHNYNKFRGGQGLVNLIKRECPNDKTAILLLTTRTSIEYFNKIFGEYSVFIVQIEKFLKNNNKNIRLAKGFYSTQLIENNLIPLEGKEYREIDQTISGILVSLEKQKTTLDKKTFVSLLTFIERNYEPFLKGDMALIHLNDLNHPANQKSIKAFLGSFDQQSMVQFILDHEIISDDLEQALQQARHVKAAAELKQILVNNNAESDWKKWFKNNRWRLNHDFIALLDEN